MTEFSHSIVLFSGDDGLPLEFNVRNTNDKALLRAMIEHGGGLCTQSDNAVHLISPGTKVLNADLGKKLVSSRYIFDCVSQNYLLEVTDYVFMISEAPTSDISDEDSERILNAAKNPPADLSENEIAKNSNVQVDPSPTKEKLETNSSVSTPSGLSNMQQKSSASSNLSESFIEGSQDLNRNPRIAAGVEIHTCEYVPLTSTAKEPDSTDIAGNFDDIDNNLSPIQASGSLMSPLKKQQHERNSPVRHPVPIIDDSSPNSEENVQMDVVSNPTSPQKRSCTFPHYERKKESEDELQIIPAAVASFVRLSPVHAAVSSSQPETGDLDQFDNLLLNKAKQKTQSDDEDPLSQSCTVSSSADVQKPPSSAEMNSGEMFSVGPSSQTPDSPTDNEIQVRKQDKTEYQSYIQRLEAEVKKILQKPSPKSIQDKICLVKYICCVKKLSPADVLQSLQQL